MEGPYFLKYCLPQDDIPLSQIYGSLYQSLVDSSLFLKLAQFCIWEAGHWKRNYFNEHYDIYIILIKIGGDFTW